MRILERFCMSKFGGPDGGEDIVFVNSDFAAVIDGATSIANGPAPAVSVGRTAAELIRDELGMLPRGSDAAEAIFRLNRVISNYYTRTGRLEDARRDHRYRCGASAVVYSDYRRQVWRVGDCKALIGPREWNSEKRIDTMLAEIRACFLESELRRGKTREQLLERDTAREYLHEMLARQIDFQNAADPSPFNFEVLDGFFHDPGAIEIFDVPRDTDRIVLASDGYPAVFPTLSESEAELARILREDPLCFREFKTTKGVYKGRVSFDDRSYLCIDISKPAGE
jgi:glycerophosphoryl diester phosphodiesterase